jgi:succinate dehydrogenase hydrophobic anchor subunit
MFLKKKDPRLRDWPLMDSPNAIFLILVGYLAAIPLIRIIMKYFKPFELKVFLMLYNVIQVVGTFYMFTEVRLKMSIKI